MPFHVTTTRTAQPTIHHTLSSPLLFGDRQQRGQQCQWARSAVICLCVWGVREVVGLEKRVFGTQTIDWWSPLGGPGLTERRSVWVTSAISCLPSDRSLLVVAKEALIKHTHICRQIHPQIKFPSMRQCSWAKYLYLPVKASVRVCVCHCMSVSARLLKPHCWLYEGELFVCSVSLCQGDFTTVIWLVSSSPALQKMFFLSLLYSLPWMWCLENPKQMLNSILSLSAALEPTDADLWEQKVWWYEKMDSYILALFSHPLVETPLK